MRTLGLWILPLTGILLAACDGGETSGPGGGGGSGGDGGGTTSSTTDTVTTTTTSSTTSSTSSTTSEVIPGCAGGIDITIGELIEGSLDKPDQEDWYRFDGFKGQVLYVDINAQDIDQVTFEPTYIDTVVSLYTTDTATNKDTKIAQNNNPFEFSSSDSLLYTILPEDGTYCIRVAECHSVLSSSQCTSEEGSISSTFYELNVLELIDDGPGDFATADPEAGNDPASATEIDLLATQSGGYFGYTWGYYDSVDDVDVFKLTLPADVPVPFDARAHATITAFPAGITGSGSTMPTGELWIVDPETIVNPDDPIVPFARIDPQKSTDFNVPLTLDKEYLLFVNRPAGTADVNDFHFLSHVAGWGNPVEIDDVSNSDPLTPEVVDFANATSAFIEGDLLPITDLDHFTVDVPAGNTQVAAVCAGRTRGSGLRQLKITLLGDNGNILDAAATDIETATSTAFVQNIPVGSNNSVVLKVEAAQQAADTTGAFYMCGIHFSSP